MITDMLSCWKQSFTVKYINLKCLPVTFLFSFFLVTGPSSLSQKHRTIRYNQWELIWTDVLVGKIGQYVRRLYNIGWVSNLIFHILSFRRFHMKIRIYTLSPKLIYLIPRYSPTNVLLITIVGYLISAVHQDDRLKILQWGCTRKKVK